MSRIGKQPVAIPKGVEVKVGATAVDIKGPKGTLTMPMHPLVACAVDGDKVVLTRVDESRTASEQHGLRRTLVNNAVVGVTKGFEKSLEIIGVGYKVQVAGKKVVLTVGYSHPVEFALPAGVEAKADGNKLTLSGIDKELVGETAARIRRVRPPEPFKGKGIKYADEVVRRKAGKSGGKK